VGSPFRTRSPLLLRGAAAGAAGTTALNAVTYLDMAIRGRPASSTPEQTVERLAQAVGVDMPGEGEQRAARVQGTAPLLGILTGIGAGLVLGAARRRGFRPPAVVDVLAATALATLAGNEPMALLGVTDPKKWSAADWAADLVPHLAYGVVAAATLRALDRP
jgi:hypothetical protein